MYQRPCRPAQLDEEIQTILIVKGQCADDDIFKPFHRDQLLESTTLQQAKLSPIQLSSREPRAEHTRRLTQPALHECMHAAQDREPFTALACMLAHQAKLSQFQLDTRGGGLKQHTHQGSHSLHRMSACSSGGGALHCACMHTWKLLRSKLWSRAQSGGTGNVDSSTL